MPNSVRECYHTHGSGISQQLVSQRELKEIQSDKADHVKASYLTPLHRVSSMCSGKNHCHPCGSDLKICSQSCILEGMCQMAAVFAN